MSNNTAPEGGAISNSETGALIVAGSTLSNNAAGDRGGSIDNRGGMALINCTVSGNSSDIGAAIFNSGTATLLHTTVVGNAAGGLDVGIENLDPGNMRLLAA